MDAGTPQLKTAPYSVANADANVPATQTHEQEDVSKAPDERQPLLSDSQGSAKPRDGSGTVTAHSDDDLDMPQVPKGLRFVLLYTCILLGCLFIGYDTSCIATLTPVITDEFHALDDLGWYTVSYLLAQSATQLIYGQLYSFYSMKTLYELSLVIFTVGSVLSAAAPSSLVFILGRAVSGLGCAGLCAGIDIILANTTTLKYRATFTATVGAVECVALALGPLTSGSIANAFSWRASFWVLVPMGLAIAILNFLGTNHIRRPENADLKNKDVLKRIDWAGFGINVPMTATLVLGLQWAGTAYAWNDWQVVLPLVLCATLVFAFFFVEYRGGDNSMVPLQMFRERSVALGSIITFCSFAALSVEAYYLPFYFQAVRGASTYGSGLMYLPSAVTLGVTALVSGPLISLIGYYNIPLIIGSIFAAVGAGLICTLGPDTHAGQWIAYQIIYCFGAGLAFQAPYLAVQTVLADKLVPTGLVLLNYTQQTGGVIILSIAQNVFLSRLASNLAAAVPDLDPGIVLDNGALGLIDAVPAKFRELVLVAYNGSLTQVFYITLGLQCVVVVCALGLEWRSVKEEKKQK